MDSRAESLGFFGARCIDKECRKNVRSDLAFRSNRLYIRHDIAPPDSADRTKPPQRQPHGPSILLPLDQLAEQWRKSRFGTRRMLTSRPFARIVFAAAWISFQPAHARGQEVEVVTESITVSTANEGGASLLSPLPLHLVLSIDGGYDDNVPTSTTGRGSLYTDGKVTLSYDRKGVQDQVSLIAIAGGTYFEDATGTTPYDVDTSLALFVSHNVSERLKLTASIHGAYKTEPDLSSNVGLNNRRGNYFDTVDKFTATYHWTLRLATVPTFSFNRLQYENPSVAASVNRSEYTFGDELRFNLSSRTVLVPDYRFEIVNYDSFAAQDSTTHFALIGIDERFSSQLKFTVRCGATFRSLGNDGSRIDPHFEGSLDYALDPRSYLSWQTSYGVEESNGTATVRSGPMSRVTFRTGLVLNYALSARISAHVSAYYHHDENQGLASIGTRRAGPQDTYDLSLTGVYTINRRFTFHLGFQRSQAISGQSSAQSLNQFTQPYSRGRYFAGLTFKY
jgi:hypothetical protein